MANYAIFDEQFYLASYPWIKPAIDAGVINPGENTLKNSVKLAV
jgi:hypothetical protein